MDREGESSLATASKLEKISHEWDASGILEVMKEKNLLVSLQKGEKGAKSFLEALLPLENKNCTLSSCKSFLKDMVYYLRAKKEIDDTAGLILLAHIKQNKKQLNWLANKKLDLPTYLMTLRSVERTRANLGLSTDATILATRKQRVKLKPWGKVSPRQELFLRYSIFEIKALTEILSKTQKRLTAQKISIVVEYEDDGLQDEVIDVGPSEKYRFAHKMLKLEIAQETMSQGFLAGTAPTGPHLLMAASEMGQVDEVILAELMNMPELKAKKSEKGKLYLNALWSVGKAGLMAVPGGIYLILPIVVIESYFQGKKMKETKNAPTLF